ncbi:MAG: DUF1360 domain-containing protein [Verrucomicrobia bacterium]|nr:DUF1360 domain-containing protein [Verrucomicrobiota bacterium]
MQEILLLSSVTASLSFTVSETRVFRGMRERLMARSPLLGELVSCGYCLGHWLAWALTAVYQPRLFHAWWPLDYLLTGLVIAWLSAFQWAVLCWLMQKSGK